MNAPLPSNIVPRKGPELGLDGDIPKYWLEGDAFKSRFFDAMSLLFPEGEKFFITCVRDFRDQITDPLLQAQVKDFMYQEGQHGTVHTQFNDRLKAQGIAVDQIIEEEKRLMFGVFRKYFSRRFTLGQTAAAEHLTAIMAHGFFRQNLFKNADPRIRAMYAWHAVEEIEHKAVAYDVMKKVARTSYFTRVLAMLFTSIGFPLHTFMIMNHMFKVDGLKNRPLVFLKGFWWMYGPRGIFTRVLLDWAAYFVPGFHPWKHGQMNSYRVWRETFDRTGGDAIAAADATIAAAAA